MNESLRITAEPVRSLAAGAIGVAYMGIGTVMTRPIRVFMIQNLTDVGLWFSFDGITDHFPLASSSFILIDVTSNQTFSQGFFLAEGERLYVKQLAVPTAGAVYLTTFYGAV